MNEHRRIKRDVWLGLTDHAIFYADGARVFRVFRWWGEFVHWPCK